MLPTIAAICNANVPRGRPIDGKNLLPLFQGETVTWNNRSLFFYWTRRYPELYNNMALQQGAYKLVGHTNYDSPIQEFELFNIVTDPYEEHNLVNKNAKVAIDLKRQLETILGELIASDNLISPPRLVIGNSRENPVILNRNDADGERGIWAQEEIFGRWNVHITKGRYNIVFKFVEPVSSQGIMYLETPPVVHQLRYTASNSDVITMKNVDLPTLDCDLIPFYVVGDKRIFPFYVELEKLD
jgi:arylsulfatase